MIKTTVSIVLIFILFLEANAQKRIEIPGSRATIVHPEGAIISPHYSAITKPDVFEMSIIEFQGNLESKFKEINSKAYEDRGIKVYAEFELEVDGYKGKVIHAHSNPAADVVQLLIGDSSFFILASTLYSKGDKDLYKEILGYYKSIKIEESKMINWDRFIAIKYDKTNSFKLETEFINPMVIMFKNDPDSSKSYIMVQQFPNLGMFPNVESFMGQMMKNTIFQSYEIDQFLSEGKTVQKGKSVYEFSSYCINDKGERHLIHCSARLTDELATIVFAITMNKNEENEMKKFFQTMEYKN